MHQSVKEAIERLERKCGEKPYLWQIEEVAKIPATYLRAHLKGYPDNLMISINEKNVMEHYHVGIKMKDLVAKVGVTPNAAQKIVVKLSERGFLSHNKRTVEQSKSKMTFITVITSKLLEGKDEKKKTIKANFKGEGGYIESIKRNYYKCVVYKDAQPYIVNLKVSDFDVVGE